MEGEKYKELIIHPFASAKGINDQFTAGINNAKAFNFTISKS